jgi:hypothetical protein
MASSSLTPEQVFIGPGLSPFKRIVTILGVIGILSLILWIAVYQHARWNDVSVYGSTIVAVLFLGGFIWYLGMITPVPFTINVTSQRLVKTSKRGEVIDLSWDEITRIKEEFFKNGKRIGITVYRKVTAPSMKAKAWAVYRDEVDDIDRLAAVLKQMRPETCEWQSEQVHD